MAEITRMSNKIRNSSVTPSRVHAEGRCPDSDSSLGPEPAPPGEPRREESLSWVTVCLKILFLFSGAHRIDCSIVTMPGNKSEFCHETSALSLNLLSVGILLT